jgi:prepilin-type N-terminal cleavage/methylation domain-containing protein
MTENCRESGFTLVEVLIALSIISLAVVALISTLDYAHNAWGATEHDRQQQQEVMLLHRLLSQALMQVVMTDGGSGVIGYEDRVTLVTVPPRMLSHLSAPLFLSIQADANGNGLGALWSGGVGDGAGIDRLILSPDRRARFSYFAPQVGWAGSWNDKSRFPALLRAQISNATGAIPVQLMFTIQAVVAKVCATEPKAPSCRGAR